MFDSACECGEVFAQLEHRASIFGAGNLTQLSEGIGKIIKQRLQEFGARRGGGSGAA